MRITPSSILSECTGEQLLMLAIANAGIRPSVRRVLDSRAAKASRRNATETAGQTTSGHPHLVLRRAG